MSANRPVALITGASRGIGANIALHLAHAGYDLALSARTVSDGEVRDHSPAASRQLLTALPGSLAATAEAARAAGAKVLVVAADLCDREALRAVVERTLAELGAVDVLVNNGQFIGPGHMEPFLDAPFNGIEGHIQGNLLAPLWLSHLVLPGMVARGGGVVINISSAAGEWDPPAPPGQGGWGLAYGVSKAGMNRIAGCLHAELKGQGVTALNVHPGFVAVERMRQDEAVLGVDASVGAPPDVVGACVAWLLADPERLARFAGKTVEAQDVCRNEGLLPGWG